MNSKVELSVVIPVYNGEDFIASTIDSVITHSVGFNVECIVIDDGSTDATQNIINSYFELIRTHRQVNLGESSAVNKGIELAVGQYIVVVSADDPVLSRGLFDGVQTFFSEHPDVVAWYPDWNIIDFQGQILKTIKLNEFDFEDLFSKNKVLPGPGTWFRADAAKAIGGRRCKWRFVGDYDFWLRLSRVGRIVHRPGVFAQWRKHSLSTSIAERGSAMAQERISVIDEFIQQNHVTLKPRSISLAKANSRYLAAKLGFFSRSVNSRKLFFEALKLDLRVLVSAKVHEVLFMIFFPLSKVVIDFLWKLKR